MSTPAMPPRPTYDEFMHREVALVATALDQRLKPLHQQQELPAWVDGAPGWDWVIELFLRDHSYQDVARYAASPTLAADIIRQLAVIRQDVGLALIQQDTDAAVAALKSIGATPTIPVSLPVPFDSDGGLHRWRIMEG